MSSTPFRLLLPFASFSFSLTYIYRLCVFRLLGPNGLPALIKVSKEIKFKGKGHEVRSSSTTRGERNESSPISFWFVFFGLFSRPRISKVS